MKTINSRHRSPRRIELKFKNINGTGEGITKALLEKYKPKDVCSIETVGVSKAQKRVGGDYE